MPKVEKKALPLALQDAEITQLEVWSGLDNKAQKANNSLVELLYGNGRRDSDMAGFGNDETDPARIKFRDEICLHIITGWEDNSDALKLFKADPETLSVKAKADQSFYKEQYRTTYYNLRKALKAFTDKGGKKGKKKPAPDLVLALREINSALARLEKENKGYVGMVEDIKAIKALAILTKVIDPNPPKAKK